MYLINYQNYGWPLYHNNNHVCKSVPSYNYMVWQAILSYNKLDRIHIFSASNLFYGFKSYKCLF